MLNFSLQNKKNNERMERGERGHVRQPGIRMKDPLPPPHPSRQVVSQIRTELIFMSSFFLLLFPFYSVSFFSSFAMCMCSFRKTEVSQGQEIKKIKKILRHGLREKKDFLTGEGWKKDGTRRKFYLFQSLFPFAISHSSICNFFFVARV